MLCVNDKKEHPVRRLKKMDKKQPSWRIERENIVGVCNSNAIWFAIQDNP